MKMTVDRMEQPCTLLAMKKGGSWWSYEKGGEFTQLDSLTIGDLANHNTINWGNHIYRNDKLFKLNVPSAIALAANKAKARNFLQSRGVAVPFTWFWEGNSQLAFPCIARPPYHHAGREFYIVGSLPEFVEFSKERNLGGWYFSQIFEKTHEFRVHVAHGKILTISNKPLVEGEIRANQAVTEESWKALKWHEFNPVVCAESIRAVEELGLDYGAVDIMYNASNNTVAIAEVNTSPSINTEYSSGKYAKYFDWVIRHNFPAHFPIQGTSVFYNKILES